VHTVQQLLKDSLATFENHKLLLGLYSNCRFAYDGLNM